MTTENATVHDFHYFSGAQMDEIIDLVKALSKHHEPSEIFQEYIQRVRQLFPVDRILVLRRAEQDDDQVECAVIDDMNAPLTYWLSSENFHPIQSSLLRQILEEGEALLINDLPSVLKEDDDLLHEVGSLRAVPLYEDGTLIRMIIGLKQETDGFRQEELAASVWLSNMFGQSLRNLSLANDLKKAYEAVDRELKTVGQIQQSLLPAEIPEVDHLELATYYKPSQRAGGDYFDFFPMQDGKIGILIADVSGHGTPAAVVMAILHTIAHTYTGTYEPPGQFMTYLNKQLSERYTARNGVFVTAFYAVFDPENRKLSYACAGHNPPLRRGCGQTCVQLLDHAGRIPLGITEDVTYDEASVFLSAGDRVVLYTDGIIESFGKQGDMFGLERLGEIIGRCDLNSSTIVDSVIGDLEEFTGQTSQNDDCTLVVMKVK